MTDGTQGAQGTEGTEGADGWVAIGRIGVRLLRDGADAVPPEMVMVGASDEAHAAAARDDARADGQLGVAYNGLLIRSGGRLALVDAGNGWLGESEGGGALTAELRALGLEPSAIDDVVMSHGHADHIAGLTKPDDAGRHAPVFERARHWFWRDEWAYWTSEAELAAMPAHLADPARTALAPLEAAGIVNVIDAASEVADGVRILPAPGHTPGHVVVSIQSEGASALYLGDAVFHAINVAQPEWSCVFDVDPAAAVATRRRLLEMAAGQRSLVFAAHLPTPGRVESARNGYRFASA